MLAKFIFIGGLSLALLSIAYAEEGGGEVVTHFAKIDGVEIPAEVFVGRLRAGYREKFYHGTPPKAEVEKFQADMVEEAVNEVLLVAEAHRRELKVAVDFIDAEYQRRTADMSQDDIDAIDDFPARLRARIETSRLVELVEQDVVNNIPEPNDAQVLSYYEKTPELFTTPSRDRVQMILLGVPAYAGQEMWAETTERAAALVADLREGADFAEMAMIHSSDPSAANGGDMGFLHKGMLGGSADQMVGLMSPGDISEPVLLLEGVATFKLIERSESALNDFSVVKDRAKSLLVRELKEAAWVDLKATLNLAANVVINPVFLPAVK
ncbi:Survival protein SurA precursor (Peptidyl-prolyl cis-trans isomerase SurA) [hydrothermal vent metagenome]|uniref:Survival protein SurA (Peptidyl-prolyl cis-trans isomerase SurA) n=1 Tax=hydrothermal vent metagenome TaxID=652676 RepID=A0A3B0ZRQ3_9ZZZZ